MFEVTWESDRSAGVIRQGRRGKKRTTFKTREEAEAAIRQWETASPKKSTVSRYEVVPARAKEMKEVKSFEEVHALLQAAGNLIQLQDLLQQFTDDDHLWESWRDKLAPLPNWGPRPEYPPEGMVSWNQDYALYFDAEDPMGPWFLLPRAEMDKKLHQAFRELVQEMQPPRLYENNALADHVEETTMEVDDDAAVEVVRNAEGKLKGAWVTARVWVSEDEIDLPVDEEVPE